MPDTLEIRSLKRKNVKSLSLAHEVKHGGEPAPEAPRRRTGSYVKEQLDSLEVFVDFKLDLVPEEFELKDLITLKELPDGMSGQVSLVRHAPSGVMIAKRVVNVSHSSKNHRAIQRELQIMRDCSSQFLVQCYGAFYDNQYTEGRVSICMELMDLGSLADISRNCGPIRIDVLGKIAEVVLGAITYLYSNFKVMHRNLKPSKILLNSLGQIKLSDFRASGELMNSIAETVVGSAVCYMAPERIRGESYTIEAEVWSFGLTIIELAIGKFPYQVTPDPDDATGEGVNILDLLQHIALGPAPKLPESDAFPDILRQMIEKCVQKDPQDRSNPVKLYEEDAFIQAGKQTPVDLTAWLASCNVHNMIWV